MKDNKLKIGIFHTEFVYSGGAERVIFRQMEYIVKKGHEVVCFTAYIDKKECYPKIINNFDIRQILPSILNKYVPHDLMIILTTLLIPFHILRFRKFDVFIGENQAGPFWAYIVSRMLKRPFITWQPYPITIVRPRRIDFGKTRTTFLATIFLKTLKPAIILLDRKIMESAYSILACGIYTKKILEDIYGRKAVNCSPGTDSYVFNDQIFNGRYKGELKLSRISFKKPYVLITNRHFEDKRFEWGIQAISQLRLRHVKPEVKLIITGFPTEYTKKLKALIKRLRLTNNVIFTNLINEEDLRKLYQQALVYIYTAAEEDFGIGIIEAMSAGVPVIAWRMAGPQYIIKNNQTGFLANPYSIDDLTTLIANLLENNKLNKKIGNNAYHDAGKYSWDRHGEILLSEVKKAYANF